MVISAVLTKKAKGRGKHTYTLRYGDSDIVDIKARKSREAEEKFLFLLIFKLRGHTLDFEPENITKEQED